MSGFLTAVLATTLWAIPPPPPKPPPSPPPVEAPKAPPERPAPQALSPEDREVVENLELLEGMDEAGDLDLLLELARED
ncbi:hypothetical protein [Stigmatella aurantiaca]|uniref:Uncharacterized protein n=1 Tax=Stigmatella aurantiaca (strain DW4/3-1) TaxID=378806 RepID=E3FZT7_STIAD|nr:hypothetical protein [Stigmatella aurantiaca]ADO69952.1 uncharacterized protein STAUR_2148 [Stigmatella aurantiaca DW4/3-1]